MCNAVCANPLCDDLALRLYGPTLLDRGCCEQARGCDPKRHPVAAQRGEERRSLPACLLP
jgi:hypothetical protein